MAQKEKLRGRAPFAIQCTNCESHDVTITAIAYSKLSIICSHCGSRLDHYQYNEMDYEKNSCNK